MADVDDAAALDPTECYLLRGEQNIEADGIAYDALMSHFQLEAPLAKMAAAALPQTYQHLLRGVGEARDSAEARAAKGDLVSLLQGVPFDRPIEPLPENLLKSAFQLPAGSRKGPVMRSVSDRKTPGLIHAPPLSAPERAAQDDKLKKHAKNEMDRREKKKEKKKKREREDAALLQGLLAPLVSELRGLTWTGWIVNGKAANPFIQKITKENCKRLGVPMYFDFVKDPMDLTRMKEKVERAEYSRIDQFTNDIKLMVANAKTFNRVGEPVHQMAIEIEQLYDAKLTGYKATFEELQQERKKRKKEKKKKKDKKKDK